jgi:AAA domain-containing protein
VADLKYKLQRLSDYPKIPSTERLIDPYLPLGGQILLAALPKTFKTYVGLSWACCVATGDKWLGRSVKKGKVLYIALESYYGVLRRKEAWRKKHGHSKADLDNLVCITVPINFAQYGQIDTAFADLAAQRFRPDFIVIDTWFKSTAGAKVSDQAEMTAALDRLTAFQKKLEQVTEFEDSLPLVTVLILAHTDKKGIDLFGSVAQFANCDALYMLNRQDHALEVTLSCVGARDIEEPADVTLGLEKVSIDTANGPEENLAVVKEVSILDKPASEIGKDHSLAMEVLADLGSAGYDQWYEETKSRRGGKLSTAAFDKIVKDLVKANRVRHADTSNVWVDALGKTRKSKGLYQVVSEGAEGASA